TAEADLYGWRAYLRRDAKGAAIGVGNIHVVSAASQTSEGRAPARRGNVVSNGAELDCIRSSPASDCNFDRAVSRARRTHRSGHHGRVHGCRNSDRLCLVRSQTALAVSDADGV